MLYKHNSKIRDLSFIHFGNSTILNDLNYYNDKKFTLNKPTNALWASPYTPDSSYNSAWEEYCVKNKMDDKVSEYTLFRLKSSSKILVIDSFKDLFSINDKYIFKDLLSNAIITQNILNIDNIQSDFDGIFITKKGLKECSNIFHAWEVESLALFTTNVVVKLLKDVC